MSKVLVVDDDQSVLEAMEVVLNAAGYEVEANNDGQEALKKIRQPELPDLVLLDVLLSGMDGRDICRNIKTEPDTKQIPVIMVSAHPSAHDSIKSCGADDFLAKPFELTDLEKTVAKYLPNS